MGAVYVTAKLSNATDVDDVERGLLRHDQVRSCVVEALVDTGATRSIISSDIAERLGLRLRRTTSGYLADGSLVSCGVCSGILFEVEGRETLEDAYVMGDSVVIGQTVLESTDLLVDCINQRVIPGHPEGPLVRF